MKHLFSIAFLICFIIFASGCSQKKSPTIPSGTQPIVTLPVEQEKEPEIQVAQQPMYAVSLPLSTQNFTADNGENILTVTTPNIEIILPDQDIADAIIIDYLNRTDRHAAAIDTLYDTAKTAYASRLLVNNYLYRVTYSPERIDCSILSLFGQTLQYTGNTHPELHLDSMSYDLITGKPLTLKDILIPKFDIDTLLPLITKSINTQNNGINLFEGYEKTVAENLRESKNWYLSNAGLVFYYAPYEIGPYASGVITGEIAYADLTGILKDAYFPAESDNAPGSLFADPFTVEAANKLTQSAELICTDNGTRTIIYTDGLINDLRIKRVYEQNSEIIFAIRTLSPGDGIILHCSKDNHYEIQYTEGTETKTFNLSFSPDGTPEISS